MKRATAAIEARDMTIAQGHNIIASDISFTVAPGEVVAVIGPNGAGKSTLLATLAGDLPVAHGDLLLEDMPIDEYSASSLARTRAMMTQESTVSFPFTTREVVALGRHPWAGRRANVERRELEDDDTIVASALADCDLEALADRPVQQLSGGEKSRVAFARALAQRAPILLLDEPTAALDFRHQESVLGQVRLLAEAGAAVVMVVHDVSLAAAYADRIATLADGAFTGPDRPEVILTGRHLSSVYGSSIDVFSNPHDGSLVVTPLRERAR